MLSEQQYTESWKRQSETLIGFATLKVGRQDARDLVSTAYLKAWAARESWNETEKYHTPDAWIFRILANLINDYWKSSARKEVPATIAAIDRVDPLGEIPLRDVEDAMCEQHTFEQLLSYCRKDIHRRILRMAYREGLTNLQIAARLGNGCSDASVKQYRARSLRRIRESLGATTRQ